MTGRVRVAGLALAALILSVGAATLFAEYAPLRTYLLDALPSRVTWDAPRAATPPADAARGWAQSGPPPAGPPRPAGVPTGQAQDRPFQHTDHEALSCGSCHAAGEQHRTPRIWSPVECAACHHDPGRPWVCADCHATDQLPSHARIETMLSLSVRDSPVPRTLPFDHADHADVTCQQCHTAPVTLAVTVACASCHVEHHRPEAVCVQCHQPSAAEAHGLEVHLGCGGAGCHSADPGWQLPHSRSVCVSCHTDQLDHEPGGDCAACHMIPARVLEIAGTRPAWFDPRGIVR